MDLLERIDQVIKHGWRPSLPDFRDWQLEEKHFLSPLDLPPNFDPRGDVNGPYDQTTLGSCVYNAIPGCVQHELIKQNYDWPFMPSRLFAYYNGRVAQGTVDSDSGDTLTGGLKSIVTHGLCPESGKNANPDWSWDYDVSRFKEKPPDACYQDARLHCALEYRTVPQDELWIKSLLVQKIHVAIGFTVHNSFMTKKVASTGVMPVPGFFDGVDGGHAVRVIGYLSDYEAGDQGIKKWAIVMNSWGDKWGQGGTFLMPFDQILLAANQSSDFKAITKVGFSKTPLAAAQAA